MRPAILVLSTGGSDTARRIRDTLPGAEVLGLAGRADDGADGAFHDMAATVQALFQDSRPIVGLCATGILIRMVAPLLSAKRQEAPVVAVSEDGRVVVPLVGSLTGGNELAQRIAAALGTVAAITGSGARKFGMILERPPAGWACANPDDAKRVTADLLAGATARVEGDLPWLAATGVPLDPAGGVVLRAATGPEAPPATGLLYRPRCAVGVLAGGASLAAVLDKAGIDPLCLAAVAVPATQAVPDDLPVGLPVRVVDGANAPAIARSLALPGARVVGAGRGAALVVAPQPVDPDAIGRPRGRLAVVGLGPGGAAWLTPEARAELEGATDIVGYAPYVAMVPAALRARATCHASDNRVEVERAHRAMTLAAAGHRVAVVSSGDPGIFAMAAALMEALETPEPSWASVEVAVLPGISAMQAAAARAGAPLGHDFAAISLSANLKPWSVVERRLEAALAADLVLALYNPVSKARPHDLARALALVARHRGPDTPVVLGSDVGRAGERLAIVRLGDVEPAMAGSRTVILVGSSQTRLVAQGGCTFVHTPRRYPDDPA